MRQFMSGIRLPWVADKSMMMCFFPECSVMPSGLIQKRGKGVIVQLWNPPRLLWRAGCQQHLGLWELTRDFYRYKRLMAGWQSWVKTWKKSFTKKLTKSGLGWFTKASFNASHFLRWLWGHAGWEWPPPQEGRRRSGDSGTETWGKRNRCNCCK